MINTEQFLLLAGNPASWDQEVQARVQRGESLPDVQRDQYLRGRLGAQLVLGARGWCVRGATSLQVGPGEEWVTEPGGTLSYAEAMTRGIEWAQRDPEMREFFVAREVTLWVRADTPEQMGTSVEDEIPGAEVVFSERWEKGVYHVVVTVPGLENPASTS